jgi:NADPH-dependent 2,4-dienoyl-CoA reductase/sulfur reductase-like enzyme
MARRYLIIGSGVAALAAAEALRDADTGGEITVVGDDPHGYYSRPGLAYALNQALPEQQIFPRPISHLRDIFSHRVHARVTELLPANHEVVLQNGRRLGYDRLLLATGSVATPGDFPGHDLHGVVKLDTLEDVRSIVHLARRARAAVVVGGGIIAIELAEGLAAHGLTVHYFLRTDRFWSSVLNETESRMVEQGLADGGIRLHYRTLVEQALGRRGAVAAVLTKAGMTVPCQILGVAIGLRARTELAKQAGLVTRKGVLVDEHMATSAPDIYAAGDVAEMRTPGDENGWFETLWPKARLQGEIAGRNMAGQRAVCTRNVMYNPVRIGGIVTTTIGSVNSTGAQDVLTVVGKVWNRQGVHAGPADRIRVLVGPQRITGALVMGEQSAAQPLLCLIEQGVDVAPLRPALEQQPQAGIELLAQFYREWERRVVEA